MGKQIDQIRQLLDELEVETPTAPDNGNSPTLESADAFQFVTSCLACNSRKNRRAIGDFLAEDSLIHSGEELA